MHLLSRVTILPSVGFAGTRSLTQKTLLFKYVLAEVVLSLFITPVLSHGSKPRNTDKSLCIILVFTGANFSARYARAPYHTYSWTKEESIRWLTSQTSWLTTWSLNPSLLRTNTQEWYMYCIQDKVPSTPTPKSAKGTSWAEAKTATSR